MSRTDTIWTVGRLTIGTATKLLTRLQVYGAERMPDEGGLVVAANHFSWIDPPALGEASPRTLYYMAKVEAHRVPGLGQLMRTFGAFPVRRGESDRDAVRTMRQIVRDGHALGMFAEGTRQRSGVPGPVQPGAAMVAVNEGVPLIPGRHPRQPYVAALELPAGVGRVGRADDLRRAAEGREGLQGGVGRGRAEDPRALALARRAARARPPVTRRGAAAMRPRRRPSVANAKSISRPLPSRPSRSREQSPSSATRTSASRRSSTDSPRRAPRSSTRRPASRATGRSSCASGAGRPSG